MTDKERPELDVEPDKQVSRRGFVDWFLGSTLVGFAGAVIYPVLRYIFPPASGESAVNSVILPLAASDLPPNSGQIFKFGTRPGIIVRNASGDLRAFSARCTHLDCTVQFRDDLNLIWCACHNGQFDLNGRVVSGPPPAPLESFDVRVRGDQIVVTRQSG